MEEKDKELYERTRKATEESHKEAQVQFQSLVKAWPCFQNLGPLWQLLQYSEGPDFIPIACEAASCTCLLLTKKVFAGMLSLPVHIVGSVCLAFFCTTLLGFLFMVPKWYRRYRGVIFKYLAAILCVWESMQIFLMGDTQDLLYVTYHSLALSMCTSVFYQVPYFIHLRWRFIGTVVQATALLAAGNWRDVAILLSIITTSHLSGFLLVYILDERRRLESLKLTSRLMGENLSTGSTKSTYSEESATTLFEHYYNLVCSQAIAKPTLVQVGSVTCSGGGVHQVARRRALGGFAGGFAGVSGLKCQMTPPTTSLLSCSENSLSQQKDWMKLGFSEFGGDDKQDNATSSSICTVERFRYTNKHKQQWEALKGGVSSIDSACSKTGQNPGEERSKP